MIIIQSQQRRSAERDQDGKLRFLFVLVAVIIGMVVNICEGIRGGRDFGPYKRIKTFILCAANNASGHAQKREKFSLAQTYPEEVIDCCEKLFFSRQLMVLSSDSSESTLFPPDASM